MPEGVSLFAFVPLALLALAGSVGVMASRNVVHAAFWLLEVLVTTAAIYLALSAEFLALVQVMVYAGAVAVLLLFVIMITLRRREDAERPLDFSMSAALLASAFGLVMIVAIAAWHPDAVAMPHRAPDIAAFGTALFGRWMLPFELASAVLLAALVGAVWWAGRDERR